MAVTFADGVVIGADSRTSSGTYVVRDPAPSPSSDPTGESSDRQTHAECGDAVGGHADAAVTESVYVCRSGSAADTQAIADIGRRTASPKHADLGQVHYYSQMFAMQHENRPPTVYEVAQAFNTMIYSNKDSLSAGIIVAGWDATGPSVYNIPLGGGIFRAPWAIGGSGSTYIYGQCDATWRPGWSRDRTVDFVRDALTLAMSRDGSSGGVVRMAIITSSGVERVFVPNPDLPQFEGGVMGAAGVRRPLELESKA